MRNNWTPEEDKALVEAVERVTGRVRWTASEQPHSSDWAKVAPLVAGRTVKQCRERWTQSANPAISRVPFTLAEVLFVLDNQRRRGNLWQRFAEALKCRTALQCRNCHSRYTRALLLADPDLYYTFMSCFGVPADVLVKVLEPLVNEGARVKRLAIEKRRREPEDDEVEEAAPEAKRGRWASDSDSSDIESAGQPDVYDMPPLEPVPWPPAPFWYPNRYPMHAWHIPVSF
jgi:hypothetical protein